MSALVNTGSIAALMASVMVVGFAGHGLLAVSSARAQEAPGVSFIDHPAAAFGQDATVSAAPSSEDHASRFAALSPTGDAALDAQAEDPRAMELEVSQPINLNGVPLDVSVAQRASFTADRGGDLNRRGHGSEVRVSRALGEPSGRRANSQEHRVYMFAASDDEALTWQPTGETQRGIALQGDRVEVGDRSAGVTYERNGVQASIAYVEREVSATVGRDTVSQNENFAGVTVTMRH